MIPPPESNIFCLRLHSVVFVRQSPHLFCPLSQVSVYVSPAYLSSCHSLFLALRPVLFSTELSSFSRLGGIIPSPPIMGFLPTALEPVWTGNGIGCWCLDGEGRRRGWRRSTEVLLCGTSGGLSGSLWFGQLAVGMVLWWSPASLEGLA